MTTIKRIASSLVRHALTAIGGGVSVGADSTEARIAGAAAIAIGAIASLIRAARQASDEEYKNR